MNTMLCLFALLISLTVITSSIAPIRIDTTCHDERYFYSSALNLCILNTRYFDLTGKTQSWLGAEKYDGQWSWIDKSPFDYQRFDKKNSSGCFVCDGALLDATDLLWKPVDSSTYNSFICVAPPFIPTTTTRDPSVTTDSFGCYPAHKQPPFNCKEGWQYAPELGYEYLVFSDSFYDDTETYCVSQGAHLVSIHSEAENDFVAGLCCVSSDHYLDAGFYITGGIQLMHSRLGDLGIGEPEEVLFLDDLPEYCAAAEMIGCSTVQVHFLGIQELALNSEMICE
ncbi:unnamed protein product, partial [Mesorhabditis belari]|uniref:C-type lectin domain-containing protein n=1 Tax=Mesorhabditis belari TaxID=2138241 RepID=A0AAF3FT91_9BILA